MNARLCALAPGLLVIGLVLAACGPARTPSPTATLPTPTATPTVASTASPLPAPSATATAAPSPSPAVEAGGASSTLPNGWHLESNAQLSIALPPGWRAIAINAADAQGAFNALQESSPVLAGVLGGPEALEGAAFWAFGPALAESAQGAFVDNMNIRRSPLGAQRITDPQEILDVLVPEYQKMGLTVTSTDATLRVGEFPAARITYTVIDAGDSHPLEMRGRQYVVATDEDLWVLSFTTTPGREARVAADFETSALSFRPE